MQEVDLVHVCDEKYQMKENAKYKLTNAISNIKMVYLNFCLF